MADKKKGTLIKVYPSKRKMVDGVEYDSVLLFYRDEHGVKKTKFIDRAEVPFYVIKDKDSSEASSPPMFIEKDKVDKIITWSDQLYKEVAVKTDSLSYYDRVLSTWGSNSRNMMNLFKHNHVYDADMDIADRYIMQFHEEFEPDISYKLHKCYFDIEVDLMENGFSKDSKGQIGYMGFPDEDIAPCPINIISLFDQKTMRFYTYILRNSKNELLKQFELESETFKSYIIQKIGEDDSVNLNGIDLKFFNSEEELIEEFFKDVHNIDPDFMLAWNESFDLKTIINRLKKLYQRKKDLRSKGVSSYDNTMTIVSDSKYFIQYDRFGNPIYLEPKAYYYSQKDKPFVDRIDSFTVLDGINWMDQMLYYANIRKVQGQKESYSLDAIALEELDKEKLPFGPGETHKNIPWINFKKFAEYNIRDVLLLFLIESNLLDMDLIQRLSEITNTRKEKVFRKTVSLKNFVNKYALENGYIMTNNKNASYGNDSDFFEQNFLQTNKIIEHSNEYKELFDKRENFGAYVADPNLNLPDNGIVLNGKPSKYIFENVFDEDFASLYPSIIRAFNLDKNTQIGKFFLSDTEIKDKLVNEFGYSGLFAQSANLEAEDGALESTNDLGPTLVDSIMSFDFVRIGEKFFNLPSTDDLIKIVEERRKSRR
jgi:DNA polymerase elongation subunit (family B)